MHSYQLPHSGNTIIRQGQPITVNDPPVMRKPKSQWPAWALALSLLKNDTDRGIGDVIERTIGPTNSAKFKAWYLAIFKQSCGCSARKERWNNEFPF